MGILDKIKEIEAEMARTQKNKATEGHLGILKAKLAKLRSQLLEPDKGSSAGKGEGFEVGRVGDARVALIGFPSVGKSTLLNVLTETESLAASYEFTTLTCIPGNIVHKGTKIQILDLPGIIEGAAHGKGRGRQVCAVAKSADLVLMVLDAAKEGVQMHRDILERELHTVGLRLNQDKPNMTIRKKPTGGIKFTNTVPLTKLGPDPAKTVYNILHEYKMHNAEVLIREDVTVDQIIDVVMDNRRYVKCIYAYNKIDQITIEEVDKLARLPNSTIISGHKKLNIDGLVEKVWDYLGMRRVYTKKRGSPPDFTEPLVLTEGRHGYSVEAACHQIHREIIRDMKFALVWGSSTKHSPQTCGLSHELHDEDVIQIALKTNKEQRQEKDYSLRVQEHYDKIKVVRKKRSKGK